jgi:hemoglobin-like flavoprotein
MKKIIFAVLLLTFFIFSALFVYSRSNLTVVRKNLPDSVLTQKTFNELLEGEKIAGQFMADQNFLGQVLIRFYNFDRINKDSVIFRLKEEGGQNWYYEHTYKTDQFLPNEFFTFGFPPILDSKGKTYTFEIESLAGQLEDAVTLSRDGPSAAVIYQYPKSLLAKNPNVLASFAVSKISNSQINSDLVVSLVAYVVFICFILLLEYLLLEKIFQKRISLKKINSSYIIVFALLVLSTSFVLLYLKKPQISENLTIAAYFLLTIGIAVQFVEILIKRLRK